MTPRMATMNWKRKVFLGCLLLLGLFLGWRLLFGKKTTAVTYETASVVKGTLVNTVSGTGTVIAANTFTIKTSASGVVTKVYVKDGDPVVRGQKIAEIELDLDGEQQYAQAYASHISASNQLQSAQNNLRSAEASLQNVYDQIKGHDNDETFAMKDTRTKAEVAHDNAFDAVKNAQANLINADFNLRANSPVILAPNSGTIQGLAIAEGMPLSAQTTSSGTRTGQRIASIVKEGSPLISISLSEIDIPKIAVGQKATITFDSIADKTFSGVVTAIDRTGSVSSNVTTYPAIIKLDSGSPEILANMAATANIITQVKTDVLLVPNSAVTTSNGTSSVQVRKNNQLTTVEITTGASNDSQTEILSGINEGETVVTTTVNNAGTSSNNTTSPFSGFNRGGTNNRSGGGTRVFIGPGG